MPPAPSLAVAAVPYQHAPVARRSRFALLLSVMMLGACGASSQGPVMSQGPATNRAQAAFDAGRWGEAAIALAEVSQTPSESEGARQLAEYRLGVSLERLGLRAAGMSLFKAIAGTPAHAAREA